MKYYSSILVFLFFCLENTAQLTLSGTVQTEQQTPIEFANILLQGKDENKFIKGEVTDAEGAFHIVLPENGVYEITISFVGYEDWQDTLEINTTMDLDTIVLPLSNTTLEEVTVTETRPIIERVEDKLIFNVASSPLKSGYDGMEVLQRSPNIWVGQNGAILMRDEAATVLINGRILNWSGEDLANYISNLRSEDIQSIQIQTNPSSNTDAANSGGIINIILKKKPVGFNASWRNYFTARGKGYHSYYSGLNFDYGAEKWNLYGSYNYTFHSNERLTKSSVEYYNTNTLLATDRNTQDTMKRHNFQLGVVVEAAKNHVLGIEVFGLSRARIFDNENLVQITRPAALIDEGSIFLRDDRLTEAYNATFNYTWTLDTLKSQVRFFADYSTQQSDQANLSESTYELGAYPAITERNNAEAQTEIYALQLDVEKNFRVGTKIETGAKMTLTNRQNSLLSEYLISTAWETNNRSTDFEYSEQIGAAYASISQSIGEHYFLKTGIRLEHTALQRFDNDTESQIEQNYWTLVPSFYLSRNFTDKKRLAFSYTQRISRPSFTLLNNNIRKINDFRFQLGNPDLQPEYVHRFELSFNHKKQSLETYYNLTTDAINGIYYLEDDIAYYKIFNAGTQKQYGVQYNRFGNLNKWWYLRASAHLYRRKFTNEEGEDSFTRNSARLQLYNNFKINSTTNIDIVAYYFSPTADAFYIAEERYSLDLMFQKFFFDKKLNCRIYFNDVFNTLVYANERPFETFRTTSSDKPRTRRVTFWMTYNFSNQNKVNKRKNQSKNEARGRL